jgi:hypothetical protein
MRPNIFSPTSIAGIARNLAGDQNKIRSLREVLDSLGLGVVISVNSVGSKVFRSR